jgi:disulfide bond formation protein DsbB
VEHVETANTVATVLTLLANVAVVVLVVVGLGARLFSRTRPVSDHLVRAVGTRALPAAFAVAVVTTAGSLYYSEVVGYVPCELCWYQRICMYPLVAILGVSWLRKERRSGFWYAAPFVAIGAPLALYHWLVERVPSLASGSSCSPLVPCTVPYFEELGYVTLAFMDMSAFLLIGALLLTGRAHDRSTKEVAA